MPFIKHIKDGFAVMETSYSDTYVPEIMGEAVALLAEAQTKAMCGETVSGGSITVNELTVLFSLQNTAEELHQKYDDAWDRRNEAYRASPEGIRRAQERADKVIDMQGIMDLEMAQLRAIALDSFQNQKLEGAIQPQGELAAKLFGVLARLIDAGDFSGVKYSKEEIVSLLEACGYVNNEYVGRGNEIVNLASNRAYVAGQIINCLATEGPFQLLPPFAAHKIRVNGLDTDTLKAGS